MNEDRDLAARSEVAAADRSWILAVGAAAAAVLVLTLAIQGRRGREVPSGPLVDRPVTSAPGNESFPAISPDGTLVAYVAEDGESAGRQLWIQELKGGDPRRLTSGPGTRSHPAWSPDGHRLACVEERGDSSAIVLVPLLGGETRALARFPHRLFGLDWAPDGTWLVTAAGGAGGAVVLERCDAATGARSPLSPGTGTRDYNPVLSPDGAAVAFIRGRADGTHDILVHDLARGETIVLVAGFRYVMGLDWLPDGRRLLVSADRGLTLGLCRIALADGAVDWLPVRSRLAIFPSAAADGRVVFEDLGADRNIWRARATEDGGLELEDAPLVASARLDLWPSLSPDGRRLAFISTRSGDLALWTCRADGTGPRRLTDEPFTSLANPRWSPDGRLLAFSGETGGKAAVWVTEAGGGRGRRPGASSATEFFWAWSADGRWLYLSSDRDGRERGWRVRTDGSDAEPLDVDIRRVLHADADGGLYVLRAEPGLWHLPGDGGPPRRILERMPLQAAVSAAFTGAGVYFGVREGDVQGLAHLALDAGPAEPRVVAADLPHYYLSASADGRTVLYDHSGIMESDLVLIAPTD